MALDWWDQLIQNSIIGIITVYGIKEGFPIVKMLVQELLKKCNNSTCPSVELQDEILRRLDIIIEHEIKNLAELANNHSDLYRLLSEKGVQASEIVTVLKNIELSLAKIATDLRLREDLFFNSKRT